MAASQDLSDLIPLLDFESIATAVSEISDGNVTITAEELKKLKPQKTITIYKSLLFTCCESASEQLNQVQLQDMDRFRYPRIYEEAVGLCTLAVAINKVLLSCGINNFTMKDLLAPKPKRTHKLLSALVNRIQFSYTKSDLVENAFEQSEEMQQRKVEMEDRKKKLINRIAEMKEKKAEDQKTLTKLTPQNDSWMAEYNKMQDQTEAKKNKLENLARIAKIQGEILEISKTKGLIEESGAVTIDRTRLLNRLSYKERQLFDLEEDSKTALKLIENLVLVLKKHADTTKRLEDIKDRVGAKEQDFKNLAAVFQNMKRQENSKHDKLARISVQHRKVFSSTTEAIELEKKKRSAIKNDVIMKIRNRLEEIENEERELSEVLDTEKLEFHDKMKNAAELYGQILDQLDIFHHSLTKGWEMTSPFFAEIPDF